ncbi:MAG: alpha/beta hydrolase [Chloroflexota bacterium]
MKAETVRVNIPIPSFVDTNGVRLHIITAGDKDGAPVLMLHGFPEFWYAWHDYITPLAEAGYRVLVPDQRGYNLSDKPKGLDAYRVDVLVADMIGLLDALDHEKVHLVGHDWGAVIAWYMAIWHPERIEQLTIANVPHPTVFEAFIRSDVSQMLKSWYAGSFQIPVLPELAIRANNWQVFSGVLADTPGITEREVKLYQQAWAQPGAMTAMLNWYRAVAQRETLPPVEADGRVRVPTLIVWGKQDPALSNKMVQPSMDMCDDGHIAWFEDSGHFVQHEKSSEVRDLLLKYFDGGLDAVRAETAD